MAQQLMSTPGHDDIKRGYEMEGNVMIEENDETQFCSWAKQNGLNNNILILLKEDGITSLNDLKEYIKNDDEIKQFVNDLEIKSLVIRKKLITAIKAIQNEKEKEQKETSYIQLSVTHKCTTYIPKT